MVSVLHVDMLIYGGISLCIDLQHMIEVALLTAYWWLMSVFSLKLETYFPFQALKNVRCWNFNYSIHFLLSIPISSLSLSLSQFL